MATGHGCCRLSFLELTLVQFVCVCLCECARMYVRVRVCACMRARVFVCLYLRYIYSPVVAGIQRASASRPYNVSFRLPSGLVPAVSWSFIGRHKTLKQDVYNNTADSSSVGLQPTDSVFNWPSSDRPPSANSASVLHVTLPMRCLFSGVLLLRRRLID